MGANAPRRTHIELATRAEKAAAAADPSLGMREISRVTRVEPLEPHWLRVWFEDGSIHEVDVSGFLERLSDVIDAYSTLERFAQVRVEERFGSIEWPGGLDIDPDVLHGDFAPVDGEPYPRRIIRGPDPDRVAN